MKIIITPEMEKQHRDNIAQERADLSRGKITARWVQYAAGYKIYSGRFLVPGTDLFASEAEADEWLRDRHGIGLDQKNS